MAENPEKQCFTFFAFLPPYFGVSGSLVSRKRKSVKRSIDWYQKFLISCLAARYSTVFVFSVTHGDGEQGYREQGFAATPAHRRIKTAGHMRKTPIRRYIFLIATLLTKIK